MARFLTGMVISAILGGVILGVFLWLEKEVPSAWEVASIIIPSEPKEGVIYKSQKTREELMSEAIEKSSNIKGLYMTADVANDKGAGATRLRNKILAIATSTEINGIVIDVKEVCGPDYDEKNLKELLDAMRGNNLWSIARIAVFKDASQIEVHPEWYLKRKNYKKVDDWCYRKKHLRIKNPDGKKPDAIFWQDNKGGYWLDPASIGARKYILDFSKKMIDLGFNELQFDYIRFPSDGDVENAMYPDFSRDGKKQKYEVMKSFFEFLNKGLKEYKLDIILSADLFGYTAILFSDVGIGQRLEDIGNNFDYISFMVYPSHYYSGLYLPADNFRNLPAINLDNSSSRKNPDTVVYRSLLVARDFLDGRIGTSSLATSSLKAATSTVAEVSNPKPRSNARLRPWLEDFFHEEDKAFGRPHGAEKIRMQIDVAEKVEQHGWLLWNAANVYTEEALKKE